MLKNVIFDYMGVIADIDYKKMIGQFSLIEKFKALRILVGMKKNKIFIKAFDDYQMGLLTHEDLYSIAAQVYPNAASIVPKLLNLIPYCLKENKKVIDLAKKLHNDGIKIVLLSNSIPETQAKIETSELVNYFDGFVLSHLINMMKPSKEIYEFTCETYGMKAEDTIFIDDTAENLVGAKSAKLKTMHCKKPAEMADRLEKIFYGKSIQPNE